MTSSDIQCTIAGVGAWGPGFTHWAELRARLLNRDNSAPLGAAANPAPQVIPANERRRAPLPVKIAVEVSWQALQQSGLAAEDVACVFGSGLGDTEISDYMCRVLTTDLKQLSPTKFHNSVHNAAAGYWTISSGCMKSANSIAAYQMTAGLALLEGMIQCALQQEPVLITLFDTKAHAPFNQMFACSQNFGAALLIAPMTMNMHKQNLDNMGAGNKSPATVLTLRQGSGEAMPATALHPEFASLQRENPAAKILGLLELLAQRESGKNESLHTSLPISESRSITLTLGKHL